jgi:hypothetical protein
MWINVVGDHAKADPSSYLRTLDIGSDSIRSQHANAALAFGPPALSGPEPTGFLQFSVAIRRRDSR